MHTTHVLAEKRIDPPRWLPALWLALSIAAPLHAAAPAPAKPAQKLAPRAKVESPTPRPPPRQLTTHASTGAPLKQALDAAINDPGLDGAELGFVAMRLSDGASVAEVGGDTLINPASNAKLITAAAALDALKAEYRFKTEYYVQGTLKEGTLYGNLVVKGYGDPTIVTERVARVANDLYLFGVEKITGGIVVDGSAFDAVEEARGWELEEAPDRAYAAPVSALAVNYNATALYIRPGAVGQPAVLRVDPPCEHVVVEGNVQTVAVGGGIDVVSQKHQDENGKVTTLITVEGTVSARESPFRVYRRVYAPTQHFGSVLVAQLQQRGVVVKHSVTEGVVPEGAKLIIVDKSEALTQILSDLNHYSNNIIAVTLIKTMGAEVEGVPGTFDKGLVVARRFLESKVGYQPGSYVLQNGSGLNDVNRVTARQLVRLLRYVHRDVEGGAELISSLAVAGTQGTIHFRMRDTPAHRRLRAKTGTLRGVSALSGYVPSPSGEPLAFAVLTQGLKRGASSAWRVQNSIGVALASDGLWQPQPEPEAEPEAVSLLQTAAPAPAASTSADTATKGGAP